MQRDPLDKVVLAARAGDDAACTEIVRRFRDSAHARSYGVLRDHQLAEDAVQEAFAEAFLNLDKLREPAAFPGWFKRIVIKRIDRLIRGKKLPLVSLDAAFEQPWDGDAPDTDMDRADLRATLDAALDSLPDHERGVAQEYYFQDKSQKDIADDLDVPTTTIKKRLYASRQRLKDRLSDVGPFDDAVIDPSRFPPEAQLFAAIRNGFAYKVDQLLTQHPDLIRSTNDDGLSLLLYAAHTSHHSGTTRVTDLLLAKGAHLGLFEAAALGFRDRVTHTLERDPKTVDLRGPWGRTPLHWAASGGHETLVDVFLALGANLHAGDLWGCTPLHLAAELGHPDLVAMLTDAGADIHATLKNGKTVLHLAAQSGDIAVVEALLRDKARLDVFTCATLGLDDQMKRLLRKDPYLVKARLPFGATPLHMAAEDGQFGMAEYLVDQGAELDMVSAAELGWMDEVKTLLASRPADVNVKGGSYGFTALHSATSKGHRELARLLLIKGAEVNATDHMYAKTPLGEALYFGNEAMARLLADHGGEA